VLVEGRADARFMEHWDLGSLWHRADHVVLAEAAPARSRRRGPPRPPGRISRYRVIKRYKGSLGRGRFVMVHDSVYRKRLADHYRLGPDNKAQRVKGKSADRYVLFLGPEVSGRRGSPKAHLLVPSGMRLIIGKRIYRMEQHSNPGGYQPVPQGLDPDDVAGLIPPLPGGRAHTPITLTAFEGELAQGAARSNAVLQAQRIPDPALRNRLLLNLLPPPRRFPRRVRYGSAGFYADDLARRIQAAIVASGRMDDVIEAYGRDVDGLHSTFFAPALFNRDRDRRMQVLLAAAKDTHRPVHQRHAAFRLVAWRGWHDRFGRAHLYPAVLALLRDPQPAMRVAAAQLLAARHHQPRQRATTRAALIRASAAATDPRTRIALLRACDRKKRLGACARAMRRAAALAVIPGPKRAARPRAVVVGHEVAWTGKRGQLSLRLRLRDRAGKVHTSARTEAISVTHAKHWGYGTSRFHFTPALAPGRYRAELQWQHRGVNVGSDTITIEVR
jgi:hypothetical protein